jgi:hypothetical protein
VYRVAFSQASYLGRKINLIFRQELWPAQGLLEERPHMHLVLLLIWGWSRTMGILGGSLSLKLSFLFLLSWIVGLCQAEFSSHFQYSIAVPDFVWISMCISTPTDSISSKLIKSLCSHGSLLLLFVVKVMV